MTLALAIALNAIAAVGLLGLLAYAMTRPALLRPHVPAAVLADEQRLERELAARRRPIGRSTWRRTGRPVPAVAAARS
jgi:hypothetical protein